MQIMARSILDLFRPEINIDLQGDTKLAPHKNWPDHILIKLKMGNPNFGF